MAQVTEVAGINLAARQDINSFLSAGLSILSSITSEVSLTINPPASSTASDTSSQTSNTFPFQTSQLSTGSSSSVPTSISTTKPSSSTSSSQSITATGSAPSDQAFTDRGNSGHGSNQKLPIILGVVLGLVALLLIALLICLCCRRRRRKGYIFRQRRSKSPDAFSDSDDGVDVIASNAPRDGDYDPETTQYHRYPSIPPPYQVSAMRHNRDGLGYGAPLEDGHRHTVDRSARKSLALNPVTEYPDAEQPIPETANEYRGRSWTSPNRRSSGFIVPGVPPRSPQRRSIPRKPIANSLDHRNSTASLNF